MRRDGKRAVLKHLGVALAIAFGVLRAADPAGSGELPSGRVVDLSHAFDADTIFWPTEEGFVLEPGFKGVTEQGYFYAANRFRQAEHGGTHIDAPVHFSAAGRSLDEIPLRQLMGPAVVVDVSKPCAADRDYRISVSDLEAFERRHGPLPERVILLFRTGFGRYWPDRARYLGTEARGDDAVAELHFPGLHPDAARWLLEHRDVAAVGLDTPSIDYGQSKHFETHRILFEQNVPAFENLANLEALPARGFSVIALPMKIRGGSGGPLRAVAIVPEN
ncbi:MAG: cyclase family protein [Deltaproteobacteria bacterium]|nr:MAG: cyclase family protein [Deltaproteobacteria bacterium]